MRMRMHLSNIEIQGKVNFSVMFGARKINSHGLMAGVFVTFRLHNININFAIYPARPATAHCCHCGDIAPKCSLIPSHSIRLDSIRSKREHPSPPAIRGPSPVTQHLSALHFSSIPCTLLLPLRTMELRETETSTGRMRNAHNAKD